MVRMGAMDFDFREMLIASTGFGMKAKNQLWNAAGYLSTIFRSIAGIRFEEDGMRFKPLIPAEFTRPIRISNYKYRKAILDIVISGTGGTIREMKIDGKIVQEYIIKPTLKGRHEIQITMKE